MHTIKSILSELPATEDEKNNLIEMFKSEFENNTLSDFELEREYKERLTFVSEVVKGLMNVVNESILYTSESYDKKELQEQKITITYGATYKFDNYDKWNKTKSDLKDIEKEMKTSLSNMKSGRAALIDLETGEVIPPAQKFINEKPTIKIK